MTLLDDVHGALDLEGIEHALIGAAALLIHGLSRSSLDIDLLATEARLLDPDLWSRHSLRAEVRVGGPFDPLAGVVRVTRAEEIPIDVVLFGPHGWQHEALMAATGTGVRAVTAPDLLRLKLFAGGARDRADIHGLLDLHPALADVDMNALPERCRDLWHQLLAER